MGSRERELARVARLILTRLDVEAQEKGEKAVFCCNALRRPLRKALEEVAYLENPEMEVAMNHNIETGILLLAITNGGRYVEAWLWTWLDRVHDIRASEEIQRLRREARA